MQLPQPLLDDLHLTSTFIAKLGICDSFYVDNNIPSSIQAFVLICIIMDDLLLVDRPTTTQDDDDGCFTKV